MVRNYVLSFEDAQIFPDKAKDLVEFLLQDSHQKVNHMSVLQSLYRRKA